MVVQEKNRIYSFCSFREGHWDNPFFLHFGFYSNRIMSGYGAACLFE